MKRRLLFFVLTLLLGAQAQAQLNCTVTASGGGSICPGDSLTLSATALPDTVDFRYFWSPAAGLSDSTLANPVARPRATTTYTVTVTAVDSTELVVNGDFEQGNTLFFSDYRDSISIWNEGTYSITTSPQNVHPGFSPCPDHTTGNGRMMAVNGTGSPNAVIWSQTINVTPNTSYEFSAWLTNVLFNAPTLPIIQFSINGELLDQPVTSVPTECTWSQFFTIWDSDTATTATIEIINQSTQMTGNDFAIDDISFRAICSATDQVTVSVFDPYDPAQYGLGEDQLLCDGNPIELSTTVPGQRNIVWQGSIVSPTYSATMGGTYFVDLVDDNNCPFSDTISIRESRSPQVDLPTDTTICDGSTVTFNAYDPTATAYRWTGPSVYYLQNDPRDTVFVATFPGEYEVEIENECGAIIHVITLETEDCVCKPFVPTAFTPNNDGENDLLEIFAGCDLTEVTFSIFNRWGEMVYYSGDVNAGWDGSINGADAPMGVYVFKLQYTASNFKGDLVPNVVYGDFTLIR